VHPNRHLFRFHLVAHPNTNPNASLNVDATGTFKLTVSSPATLNLTSASPVPFNLANPGDASAPRLNTAIDVISVLYPAPIGDAESKVILMKFFFQDDQNYLCEKSSVNGFDPWDLGDSGNRIMQVMNGTPIAAVVVPNQTLLFVSSLSIRKVSLRISPMKNTVLHVDQWNSFPTAILALPDLGQCRLGRKDQCYWLKLVRRARICGLRPRKGY
jgi:hypothetical protein